jgi:hypothetical protein
MPDGSHIGADMAQVPEIRNLTVTASDRTVLFRYTLTPVIQDTPCVVEVATSPDFDSPWMGVANAYVGELASASIGTHYGKDADSHDRYVRRWLTRMIAIGVDNNLSANTLYFYRLHCGGDVRRGNFTTSATLAGTTTFSTQGSAGTWGYSYSRATDTISGGGAMTHSSGTLTATVDRGRVIYWRRGTGPVSASIIR